MKKMTCMLLAVLMLLGMAACGKPAASGGPAEASTSGKGIDPETGEQITLNLGVPASNIVTDWENNALTKWLEEQTGYNIEFTYFSGSATDRRTQLTAMVSAGEKLPDILLSVGLDSEQKNALAAEGLFVDLSQWLDDDEYMQQYEWYQMLRANVNPEIQHRIWTEGRDPQGHWWGFPVEIADENDDSPRYHVYINQVWLDKLGLEMPRTYDELVAVLEAFRDKDPNGNGRKDEIPMIGTVNVFRGEIDCWLASQFEYVNMSYAWDVDDNGRLYSPYITDGYREGVKRVRELVDKGLLSPLTWTIKERSEIVSMVTPPDETAILGVWAGHIQLNCADQNPVALEYTPLPPLKGAYAPMNPGKVSYGDYITTDCEHPEAAFKLLMAAGTLEGCRRMRWGEKDVDWELGIDAETGLEGVVVLNNAAFSGPTNSTYGYIWSGVFWNTRNEFKQNGEPRDPSGEFIAYPAEDDSEPTWGQKRDNICYQHYLKYKEAFEATRPKNLAYSLIYTNEEVEERGDSASQYSTYVKEQRALFANGQKDVFDDKVWDEYVKTGHEIGLDVAQRLAQQAYDRMNAAD